MHEIFINFRTKGGKEIAYMCQQALADRFGPDSIFLAGGSIGVGSDFTQAIPQAVRRSRVLLVIVDEHWLDAPDPKRPGRRALVDPQDWVRREIEEAFDSGVLVVPVLAARKLEQLNPHLLPKTIAQLAVCQYARVQLRTFATDLVSLGDRLVQQVPGLAALDRQEPTQSGGEPDEHTSVHNKRQSGGIGHVGGSVGTFVGESHSPMHTGSGDMVNNNHENGDGTTYYTGDNGTVRQRFGPHTRPTHGKGER
ncbi:TIR domain-containing protein [Streptomyces spectabilis]|uniref:TIR domain-containing protein n=1 Tax=Streptomyces spectabilis TaxID=68270 RepID=A0A516R445_STRST|nr:TIR domain-containing protein [Streptomyces spectabilis]QDQ10426.1 TIR domain-containing protein [Streptomyces spectabilis]